MYNNKNISIAITSCKRFELLKKSLKAFSTFCTDFDIIDNVIFFDDSSTDDEKLKMNKLVNSIFYGKNIKINHLYPDSFTDKYRHARILNIWLDELKNNNSDYCFLLEDDSLFIDFFNLRDGVDILSENEEYGMITYDQPFRKFPKNINVKQIGDYWEWIYDSDLPLGHPIFLDDVVNQIHYEIQSGNDIDNTWVKDFINWPYFGLRPGLHDVKKLLNIGYFSTSYDQSNMREHELDFAYRWASKYKSICNKKFLVINMGMKPEDSTYVLNS